MAKQDESEYFRRIGEEGRQHASRKPYSDPRCGAHFLDMGMILSLLPPPPARILDLGVGTGWTSIFLANRGYDVVGQDISPEGIELANQGKAKADLGDLDFIVSDYEQMKFSSEFDGAVFYDCLHHSEDTHAALSSVYRALRGCPKGKLRRNLRFLQGGWKWVHVDPIPYRLNGCGVGNSSPAYS